MYLLELAGEGDAFARCEARSAATGVARLAPGLASARGIDPRRIRTLAYTHRASELIGTCECEVDAARLLLELAGIEREGSVRVRARRVRGADVDTQRVERELGSVLVERGFSVDLEDPDHELRAVFSDSTEQGSAERSSGTQSGTPRDGICTLGWLAAASRRDFAARAPTEKPFFQPGSMDPLLARAIANVAGAAQGKTILDPMCGTGGVLVEAGLAGAQVIGADTQWKMTRGARENLAHYGITFNLFRGDATRIPLREGSVDGIVFDAPYGRQSKIEGELKPLVEGALAEAHRIAPRAVVVADRPWSDAVEAAGWTVEDRFERRVHGSLTRYISVLG
ncbi:methyltransferase domain-containing protein [Halalkalicoccus subterraneus]|uniref:methyltransferase domain-containing protein n=1 Tax=Halalkalicoccus subterraneus TaxID=2675002 RepID=UPI000EFAF61C|nr:methyltransferase domain-containing protein [Halalkalicoccus subterraneus]